jgi:two-component system nitrogen regulation sensor histidine kinase NtrY
LFRQFKATDPENSPIYSNAVYDSLRLISPANNYSFSIWLTESELPKEEFTQVTRGEYDELWYKAGNDKVVVVARKKEAAIETITLFSYIFCSFLFLVAFVQLISLLLRTGYNWAGFRKLFELNIRTQVHSTIIFISIFSFLIIGGATISFFIKRNQESNSEKLSKTMKIMVNEMEKRISEQSTFDDVIKVYDSVSNDGLQILVNDVSDIHGVDVNVYDLNGDLQVSSEANVYTKGVVSKKIDPTAFYHLHRLRQIQHLQEEKIGNFSYLSIYSPVRNNEGNVDAYINIPYFTSKPELRQEISNFLVTIINLNAFIFLIAGLIALLITNRITNSFSIISEKMKQVNLGQKNEQILWNGNDEIGDLVQEYNKMVAKLGQSADALAKSEREGAWREMARQVAHEIKNPLTPMKLSIQYLQKAINNNQPNVKELSSNVASTLVEQIDHLAKIAADFSQFANIGNTNITRFDLHDVISSLKDLYGPQQHVNINWRPVNDKLFVLADKTQMNRLFTNLLTNAVEACKQVESCRIDIDEKREWNTVVISIKDNGEGIPPETQERIFIPNFTTKSSGTGLGLAMCKGIVEQAHGRIWFETEQGKGTTFFVELPVLEN